jgi:H+/Cl- antiporter ClcA
LTVIAQAGLAALGIVKRSGGHRVVRIDQNERRRFWLMPSPFLTGTAAAADISWINALRDLTGTGTPFIVGRIKGMAGSFSGALYPLAAFALMAVPVVGAADGPANEGTATPTNSPIAGRPSVTSDEPTRLAERWIHNGS